jgi:branched-chain amino acid transport system substrate-binding protein
MNSSSRVGYRQIAMWAVGIAALGLVVVLAFYVGQRQSSDKIRIGAILPLTGDSASWGEQGRWGVELAVKECNEAGGIDGKQVEVVFEDSQAIPRVALTAFGKLSQVDKVQAIVGDIVSATTLAMAPLAEERGVVLIAPTASAPALTKAGKYIFRVWPSDHLEGKAAADWAHAQGHQRAAVLHIANDYGAGLAEAFRVNFESGGGKVVFTQSYPQDQTDFRTNLTRVKAESPNLVYLIGYYKDVALALKQAKEMGIDTVFLGPTAVESPDLLKIAGDAAEGLVYPTIVDFDPADPSERQRQFINKFKAAYGKEPDWASSHAYDATLVILETMKSGARTGEEIRAAIDARRMFEGVTGTIRFDENGDVIDKRVVIKTVKNGKFTVLQKAK